MQYIFFQLLSSEDIVPARQRRKSWRPTPFTTPATPDGMK
jgi:hypothetical protein